MVCGRPATNASMSTSPPAGMVGMGPALRMVASVGAVDVVGAVVGFGAASELLPLQPVTTMATVIRTPAVDCFIL